MADIEEVVAYLASRYAVEWVGEDLLRVSVATDTTYTEAFLEFVYEELLGEYVHVLAPVGASSPDFAVFLAARLDEKMVGGVVLWDGRLAVRQPLALANIFEDQLEQAISQVASLAYEFGR